MALEAQAQADGRAPTTRACLFCSQALPDHCKEHCNEYCKMKSKEKEELERGNCPGCKFKLPAGEGRFCNARCKLMKEVAEKLYIEANEDSFFKDRCWVCTAKSGALHMCFQTGNFVCPDCRTLDKRGNVVADKFYLALAQTSQHQADPLEDYETWMEEGRKNRKRCRLERQARKASTRPREPREPREPRDRHDAEKMERKRKAVVGAVPAEQRRKPRSKRVVHACPICAQEFPTVNTLQRHAHRCLEAMMRAEEAEGAGSRQAKEAEGAGRQAEEAEGAGSQAEESEGGVAGVAGVAAVEAPDRQAEGRQHRCGGGKQA